MPVGDRQPIELLMDDEAWKREPARIANDEFGHNVHWDPGTQQRWTCRHCGNAVLRVGCNIYGSAVERTCDDAQRRRHAAEIRMLDAGCRPHERKTNADRG